MVTATGAATFEKGPGTLRARRSLAGGLTLVLIVAAFFRFTGLRWDENQHLHPDERYLTMVMLAERWPQSIAEYFDEARSKLNPRNVGFSYFAYGTLPTTLVTGIATLIGRTSYDELTFVGRVASALVDLGTVLLLFFAARRLYDDNRIALLASALLAVSVLPIQQAHFFVVDPFATFFIVASIWSLAGARGGSYRSSVFAGICFGLALACKVSVATFALVIAAATILSTRSSGIVTAVKHLIAAGAGMCLAFRVAEPYAFQGVFWLSSRWLENLAGTMQLMSGATDFPPGVQWANRIPILFPLENLVLWGLGPALGVTACVATVLAAWRLPIHRDTKHTIPVLWIAIVFLHQGSGFVTAARYFLPIYPMLALLAAWLLTTGGDLMPSARRVTRWLPVSAALVVVSTLFWAVAFTHIYRRPNTRVEASRWIYANVPSGAAIATEHWDDRLPLRLGDLAPGRYVPIELTNYDEDTPEKLNALIEQLNRADYVVLASNRLYDSIPRLPMRYPMTTKYYQLLFSGALGFERAVDVTSYPAIGGLQFPDQSAEESFSVYDHARVQIFRKTSTWNGTSARAMLGDVDWKHIVTLPARHAAAFKNGLVLSPQARQDARAGGTWSRMFDPSSVANRFPIVVWSSLLFLLGVIGFPLTAPVFRSLPDRGWLLSKALGLLLGGYAAWLLASFRWLPFQRLTIAGVYAAIGVVALLVAWRDRDNLGAFWREHRTLVIKEELLFWAGFAAFLLVRSGNPDLWHPTFGGEKPMDFAYLNATIRSDYFPPYNPWFAGAYINYYYFGFVLVAALAKLSGIAPSIAYNLAIPTFFALAAAGVFTVGCALASALDAGSTGARRVGPFTCGIIAVLFVTILGNLGELSLLLQSLFDPSSAEWPLSTWYWNATRVIPHLPDEAPPITEFPFFTLLYGDLHAHLMALPYTLVALACSLELLSPARSHAGRAAIVPLALLAFVTGALYVLNTWDYPTYLLIGLSAMAVRLWQRSHGVRIERTILAGAFQFAAVVAAGRLMFLPFFIHYSQAYGAILPWTGSRTAVSAYLTIHGLFLFILATWVFRQARRQTFLSWLRGPSALPYIFLLVLIAMGCALSLAVEFVVLGDDISRMNTVFKFYFQVWLLWGCASAVCLRALANEWAEARVTRTRGRRVATAWIATLAVLGIGAALYPPIATRARWFDRFNPSAGFGLDGRAYMQSSTHVERNQSFSLSADLEAMRWLEMNVDGTPVIAEAYTPEYHWGARISTNTGLPTILGWRWHQKQQRGAFPWKVVLTRQDDLNAIYEDPDIERVAGLLDEYAVEYVYVGALERILYPASGLEKFERTPSRWERVYTNSDVAIYRVVR